MLGCADEYPEPDAFVDYEYPDFAQINRAELGILNDEIAEGKFGDMHSLIILRNDKIIFENYYKGFRRNDIHPMGTATQSIVSALTGIMLQTQNGLRLDTAIIHFFPQYAALFNNIPQKDKINIFHLLNNSAGFWWKELGLEDDDVNNDAYAMTQSADWVSHVLATPMIREPGFEFNLNSGLSVLMAPIIQSITGSELDAFAREHLFDVLDIKQWDWERIPGGMVNASWGLSLRPIDMAKIGYLYLQNGTWKDRELFDTSWLSRSTRYRYAVTNYFGFGYLWWRFANNATAVESLKVNDVFFAMGDGGQFLVVVPHLDMVVVMTAGNFENGETYAVNILKDYIFPAVKDRFL